VVRFGALQLTPEIEPARFSISCFVRARVGKKIDKMKNSEGGAGLKFRACNAEMHEAAPPLHGPGRFTEI
jgi:hypothetical protein